MQQTTTIHNFKILNGDTDSITIYKEQFNPFPREERNVLLNELNEISPKGLLWEDDGYFKTVIVLKAKNYILQKEDGTIKYKGSAVLASLKEPALKIFIKDIIQAMLDGNDNYTEIYNKYVKEAMDIKDISRWSFKKSISERVLNSERANETKVLDALAGEEFQEGDKRFFYYKEDGSLGLREKFDGNYDKNRILEKLFKTAQVFSTVIPKETFPNFKLKRNKEALATLLNS